MLPSLWALSELMCIKLLMWHLGPGQCHLLAVFQVWSLCVGGRSSLGQLFSCRTQSRMAATDLVIISMTFTVQKSQVAQTSWYGPPLLLGLKPALPKAHSATPVVGSSSQMRGGASALRQTLYAASISSHASHHTIVSADNCGASSLRSAAC